MIGCDVPAPARLTADERPLSFAQHRLWMAHQLGGAVALNSPLAIELVGPLQTAALEQALSEVVRRHEVLRTVYGAHDGEPYQSVMPASILGLRCADLTALPAAARRACATGLMQDEAHRGFDLERDFSIRATLVRLETEDHLLLLTRHHIANDGWSLGILLRELASLYERYSLGHVSVLPELPMQYADVAAEERARLGTKGLETRLAYWRRQLAGCAPHRTLGDRAPVTPFAAGASPREREAPIDGAAWRHAMPAALQRDACDLCRRLGVTRFVLTCAAFFVLLHAETEETDLVIGTDVTQRRSRAAEALIGCFINRVPLRVQLSGNPAVSELLARVRTTTRDAHAHADVPVERIVASLNPERPRAGEPLFQVMFGLHAAPAHAAYWDLTLYRLRENRLIESHVDDSQFAFSLYLTEARDGLLAEARYDRNRFEPGTIRRLVEAYEAVLRMMIAAPGRRLDAIAAYLAAARRDTVRREAELFRARRPRLPLPGSGAAPPGAGS